MSLLSALARRNRPASPSRFRQEADTPPLHHPHHHQYHSGVVGPLSPPTRTSLRQRRGFWCRFRPSAWDPLAASSASSPAEEQEDSIRVTVDSIQDLVDSIELHARQPQQQQQQQKDHVAQNKQPSFGNGKQQAPAPSSHHLPFLQLFFAVCRSGGPTSSVAASLSTRSNNVFDEDNSNSVFLLCRPNDAARVRAMLAAHKANLSSLSGASSRGDDHHSSSNSLLFASLFPFLKSARHVTVLTDVEVLEPSSSWSSQQQASTTTLLSVPLMFWVESLVPYPRDVTLNIRVLRTEAERARWEETEQEEGHSSAMKASRSNKVHFAGESDTEGDIHRRFLVDPDRRISNAAAATGGGLYGKFTAANDAAREALTMTRCVAYHAMSLEEVMAVVVAEVQSQLVHVSGRVGGGGGGGGWRVYFHNPIDRQERYFQPLTHIARLASLTVLMIDAVSSTVSRPPPSASPSVWHSAPSSALGTPHNASEGPAHGPLSGMHPSSSSHSGSGRPSSFMLAGTVSRPDGVTRWLQQRVDERSGSGGGGGMVLHNSPPRNRRSSSPSSHMKQQSSPSPRALRFLSPSNRRREEVDDVPSPKSLLPSYRSFAGEAVSHALSALVPYEPMTSYKESLDEAASRTARIPLDVVQSVVLEDMNRFSRQYAVPASLLPTPAQRQSSVVAPSPGRQRREEITARVNAALSAVPAVLPEADERRKLVQFTLRALLANDHVQRCVFQPTLRSRDATNRFEDRVAPLAEERCAFFFTMDKLQKLTPDIVEAFRVYCKENALTIRFPLPSEDRRRLALIAADRVQREIQTAFQSIDPASQMTLSLLGEGNEARFQRPLSGASFSEFALDTLPTSQETLAWSSPASRQTSGPSRSSPKRRPIATTSSALLPTVEGFGETFVNFEEYEEMPIAPMVDRVLEAERAPLPTTSRSVVLTQPRLDAATKRLVVHATIGVDLFDGGSAAVSLSGVASPSRAASTAAGSSGVAPAEAPYRWYIYRQPSRNPSSTSASGGRGDALDHSHAQRVPLESLVQLGLAKVHIFSFTVPISMSLELRLDPEEDLESIVDSAAYQRALIHRYRLAKGTDNRPGEAVKSVLQEGETYKIGLEVQRRDLPPESLASSHDGIRKESAEVTFVVPMGSGVAPPPRGELYRRIAEL